MPSDISHFGDMLLSTIGFHRRVSRCPGGLLLSTSSPFERNSAYTDTAHKKVPLVLRWRNGGREDRTGEIFKNGNDIHWARIRKQVFFDISDIGTPILMASHRIEWLLEFGTRLSLMCLQAVELPVRCHDPATGRGADLDSLAFERGMDAVLSKQRVLLKLADLIANLECGFAHPFVCLWPSV